MLHPKQLNMFRIFYIEGRVSYNYEPTNLNHVYKTLKHVLALV